MQRVMCVFRGEALSPIWKFGVDFPEEVFFMPEKEKQQGPRVGGGCLGEKAEE